MSIQSSIMGFFRAATQSQTQVPASPRANPRAASPIPPPSPMKETTLAFKSPSKTPARRPEKHDATEITQGKKSASKLATSESGLSSPSASSDGESRRNSKRASPAFLSPPPAKRLLLSQSHQDFPTSPPKSSAESQLSTLTDREVKDSDDGEDEDSDSSFDDFLGILETHGSKSSGRAKAATSSTPARIESSSTSNMRPWNKRPPNSPLAPVPVRKFVDFKELARHARKHDEIQASSKKVDEIMAKPTVKAPSEVTNKPLVSNPTALLAPDNGSLHKVTRALDRTEAMLPEPRFYFFQAGKPSTKIRPSPFPSKSLPKNWRSELEDAQVRYQTFVTGFAEEMVELGQLLPDEILLWLLKQLCTESDDVLRNSYVNTLGASGEQISTILTSEVLQDMLHRLRGDEPAYSLKTRIRTIQEVPNIYGRRSWDNVRSVVRTLGRVAPHLQLDMKVHFVAVVLRMGCDRSVFDAVDTFDTMQETLFRICQGVDDDVWNKFCTDVVSSAFSSTAMSTLRLQMVQIIPSTSARTHDLKRRLAMTFLFGHINYASKHSHSIMNLKRFISRLEEPDFGTGEGTDFRELGALASLLDIAVDDGRSLDVDLDDETTAREFDLDVDTVSSLINNIMKGLGNHGVSFISKIDAYETLKLVSGRIADTVRSRPKAKKNIFAEVKPVESFESEKKGMAALLAKGKVATAKKGRGK